MYQDCAGRDNWMPRRLSTKFNGMLKTKYWQLSSFVARQTVSDRPCPSLRWVDEICAWVTVATVIFCLKGTNKLISEKLGFFFSLTSEAVFLLFVNYVAFCWSNFVTVFVFVGNVAMHVCHKETKEISNTIPVLAAICNLYYLFVWLVFHPTPYFTYVLMQPAV